MEYIGVDIEVGDRLYTARMDSSLKQIDVANLIGISRGSYSRIERGSRPITPKELLRISKALNVSILWILGENEDTELTKKEAFEIEEYKKYLIYKRKEQKSE